MRLWRSKYCKRSQNDELVPSLRRPDQDAAEGRTIKTLKEAADYALKLPKRTGDTEPWQRAAKVLHQAAEHGGPFVFIGRISFAKAVSGEDEPRIGNPTGKKAHRWDKRKLARDR